METHATDDNPTITTCSGRAGGERVQTKNPNCRLDTVRSVVKLAK